jgi:hypothetical protein
MPRGVSGPSEKRPFRSRYADSWVSPRQWVAETMVERRAASQGVKLAPRFWQGEEWGKEYKAQLALAGRLLKKYPVPAVLSALSSPAGRKFFSAASGGFVALVRAEASRLNAVAAHALKVPSRTPPAPSGLPAFSPPFVSHKSVVDRLREME